MSCMWVLIILQPSFSHCYDKYCGMFSLKIAYLKVVKIAPHGVAVHVTFTILHCRYQCLHWSFVCYWCPVVLFIFVPSLQLAKQLQSAYIKRAFWSWFLFNILVVPYTACPSFFYFTSCTSMHLCLQGDSINVIGNQGTSSRVCCFQVLCVVVLEQQSSERGIRYKALGAHDTC